MTGRSVWRALWSLVVTIGVGVGMLEWGVVVTFGCLLALTVMAVPFLVMARGTRADERSRRRVLRPAVTAAAAVLACGAFARLAPSLALLLVTMALVTSPWARRLVRGILGRGAEAPGRPVVRSAGAAPRVVPHLPDAPSATPPPLERPRPQDLDDRALCLLWRQSFWDLAGQSTPTGYLRVVAWRQGCLDEMERRDAQALHAWLESGARASGGPEKFLRHPPGGSTDAA